MVDVVTIVNLGTDDRQRLDTIIARLDTLITAVNAAVTELADVNAKLVQSGANQTALYNATSQSGTQSDQRLLMASISGAHHLLERMKRNHFDEQTDESAAKLIASQRKLADLIAEITNES